ncbi:hypothetical protein PUW24_12230 [Paenibacillus urinalis]|uniref:DUF2283 domain-containing protein n=1 Tax=Paenibacillus urinalis TaxID=521520 RepID=A0ABY7XHV3_9BACL|nr:hypothetical protein [Paenibacillus urinalis]WDH99591.1 hypothetical protein PUW24_12230 [Paenibacillus urinalis]WDI03225.1 hypothetical protein PUW25_04370 [Paenibacillus urinalis]
MKIRMQEADELLLVYIYFYEREEYIELNNGGESDKECYLLFDEDNDWIGISLESENMIKDHIEIHNGFINFAGNEWTVLFEQGLQIHNKVKYECITDLHDHFYTGIELILVKSIVPNISHATNLLRMSQI